MPNELGARAPRQTRFERSPYMAIDLVLPLRPPRPRRPVGRLVAHEQGVRVAGLWEPARFAGRLPANCREAQSTRRRRRKHITRPIVSPRPSRPTTLTKSAHYRAGIFTPSRVGAVHRARARRRSLAQTAADVTAATWNGRTRARVPTRHLFHSPFSALARALGPNTRERGNVRAEPYGKH